MGGDGIANAALSQLSYIPIYRNYLRNIAKTPNEKLESLAHSSNDSYPSACHQRTNTMTPICPNCEHYDQGFCRLVDKLAHEFRDTEEIEGGCGDRGRFFVQWKDYSKRDFENYPPAIYGWREVK